jgi:hypothetical protein
MALATRLNRHVFNTTWKFVTHIKFEIDNFEHVTFTHPVINKSLDQTDLNKKAWRTLFS